VKRRGSECEWVGTLECSYVERASHHPVEAVQIPAFWALNPVHHTALSSTALEPLEKIHEPVLYTFSNRD